jgi:hypothetical protein
MIFLGNDKFGVCQAGLSMYTDADRAHAMHAESQRLEGFLRALAPEDWQRPSRCEHWLVADVVHI